MLQKIIWKIKQDFPNLQQLGGNQKEHLTNQRGESVFSSLRFSNLYLNVFYFSLLRRKEEMNFKSGVNLETLTISDFNRLHEWLDDQEDSDYLIEKAMKARKDEKEKCQVEQSDRKNKKYKKHFG